MPRMVKNQERKAKGKGHSFRFAAQPGALGDAGLRFGLFSQGVKQDAFWGDQYKVGQKMRIYCRGIKMDPEQYEMVVKELIQSKLREDCPQANLTVIHNAKCHGKSGHEHQIDVLVELVIAGVRLKIPVECKRYSRNVGIDDIMEFASRIDDISAHKGILVSTIGFERGAVRFAASKGIALVLVCNYSWQVIMEHRLPVSQKESEQIKKDFMLKRRRTFEKILKEIFSDKNFSRKLFSNLRNVRSIYETNTILYLSQVKRNLNIPTTKLLLVL